MLFSRSQLPIGMETYLFQANPATFGPTLHPTHDRCYTMLHEFHTLTKV